MAKAIEIRTNQVADIARLLGYRRRNALIQITDKVTLNDLNWSGGCRNEFTAIELDSGKMSQPVLSKSPPWDNKYEGLVVEIPPGFAIVRTGSFCGKPATMIVYVRPENMPADLMVKRIHAD